MSVETLSEITCVAVTKDSVFTVQTDISASVSLGTQEHFHIHYQKTDIQTVIVGLHSIRHS